MGFVNERSTCCEKVGINCSCFSVEDHQFSTRTLAERKLWLRAISNLKVKLQNRAPRPTAEDLANYRAAIREHVTSIKETTFLAMDPLLARIMCKSRVSANAEPLGNDSCVASERSVGGAIVPWRPDSEALDLRLAGVPSSLPVAPAGVPAASSAASRGLVQQYTACKPLACSAGTANAGQSVVVPQLRP